MKSIGVLFNLLHHFYRGIQCDKTFNFVHDEAFDVHHEMPILGVDNFHQISSVSPQSCVFDDSVNFYKLFNLKC